MDLWTDTNAADNYIDSRGNLDDADLFIRTKTAGTPINAITVKGTGNVGIGSLSPGSKLDVAGEIRGQKFAFNDDTNTHIDTLAADQIGFTLGGNTSVRWAFVAGSVTQQFMYGASASYPSYTFQSDQDTGMYLATSGAIGFASGGSEKMRINATGLGIGTSTPGTKLHVYTTGAGLKVEAAGTSPFTQNIAEFKYLGNSNTITIHNVLRKASLDASGTMQIASAGTVRLTMDATNSTFSTHVIPSADNSKNLGSSSARWANIFSADLHLSNVGTGGNEVDGTEGDWTIQEGEEELYLLNNKNGKKYKFMLQEIK